jgi:hypothetical protein
MRLIVSAFSCRTRPRHRAWRAEVAEDDFTRRARRAACWNFSASSAPSAFQIVSAFSCRTRPRHRARRAEVAENDFKRRARRDRRAACSNFSVPLGALGVSDRLCVLLSDPFAAPGAGSGGRRGRFQTPRSPSSLLEFLGAPWRPRRFRSSRVRLKPRAYRTARASAFIARSRRMREKRPGIRPDAGHAPRARRACNPLGYLFIVNRGALNGASPRTASAHAQ